MTGFYGEMVYWVHSRVFVQEERFWGVLEGVGSRYRVQTGGFVGDIGVNGGDGGDSNGVGC